VANTAIASSVTARSENPNENTIKEFVSLGLYVPMENIGIQKIKTENPGCVALVSVHGKLLYVFKAETTRNEIKASKKFLSLTNVPQGIAFMGVYWFALPGDLKGKRVSGILRTSWEQIKGLDQRTQYYSLQPYVGATIGVEVLKAMRAKDDRDLLGAYGDLARKMGQTLAYMYSKHFLHGDFHPGNWFYDEQTKMFYLIDFGQSRNLDERYSLQSVLSDASIDASNSEDIMIAMQVWIDLVVYHGCSQPSVALLRIFLRSLLSSLVLPTASISPTALILSEAFKREIREYYEGMIWNSIVNDPNSYTTPDFHITPDKLNGPRGDIARILCRIQILKMLRCFYGEIPPIETIKCHVEDRVEREANARIKLRQRTEDPEAVKIEEDERKRRMIAVYNMVIDGTPHEQWNKLNVDGLGCGALMDALIEELEED
jgi:hypothetical protein